MGTLRKMDGYSISDSRPQIAGLRVFKGLSDVPYVLYVSRIVWTL